MPRLIMASCPGSCGTVAFPARSRAALCSGCQNWLLLRRCTCGRRVAIFAAGPPADPCRHCGRMVLAEVMR